MLPVNSWKKSIKSVLIEFNYLVNLEEKNDGKSFPYFFPWFFPGNYRNTRIFQNILECTWYIRSSGVLQSNNFVVYSACVHSTFWRCSVVLLASIVHRPFLPVVSKNAVSAMAVARTLVQVRMIAVAISSKSTAVPEIYFRKERLHNTSNIVQFYLYKIYLFLFSHRDKP